MNIYYAIMIFFTFSFIGWLMEVILTKIEDKKWVNRGFLIGPICPIYGFGILGIILTLKKYDNDIITFFIMSILICSATEYFTSFLMEKLFKNRWWDYSNKRFNINGRICLEYAIPFGLGGTAAYFIVYPFIIKLLDNVPLLHIKYLCFLILLVTLTDILVSFKIINGLKNISKNIKCDSTEAITEKVRETLSQKNHFYRRLIKSFPNMKVFNKMSVIKDKLLNNKNEKKELKKEYKKLKKNKKK